MLYGKETPLALLLAKEGPSCLRGGGAVLLCYRGQMHPSAPPRWKEVPLCYKGEQCQFSNNVCFFPCEGITLLNRVFFMATGGGVRLS